MVHQVRHFLLEPLWLHKVTVQHNLAVDKLFFYETTWIVIIVPVSSNAGFN